MDSLDNDEFPTDVECACDGYDMMELSELSEHISDMRESIITIIERA